MLTVLPPVARPRPSGIAACRYRSAIASGLVPHDEDVANRTVRRSGTPGEHAISPSRTRPPRPRDWRARCRVSSSALCAVYDASRFASNTTPASSNALFCVKRMTRSPFLHRLRRHAVLPVASTTQGAPRTAPVTNSTTASWKSKPAGAPLRRYRADGRRLQRVQP
jgi:hypothetical protein